MILLMSADVRAFKSIDGLCEWDAEDIEEIAESIDEVRGIVLGPLLWRAFGGVRAGELKDELLDGEEVMASAIIRRSPLIPSLFIVGPCSCCSPIYIKLCLGWGDGEAGRVSALSGIDRVSVVLIQGFLRYSNGVTAPIESGVRRTAY